MDAWAKLTSDPDVSVIAFYILRGYETTAEQDGYEAWFDTRTGYQVLHICRVDNQDETQLGDLIDISDIAQNDYVGIRVKDGVIQAWHKPAAGSWTLRGERSDSTYSGPWYIIPETWSNVTTFDDFGGGWSDI